MHVVNVFGPRRVGTEKKEGSHSSCRKIVSFVIWVRESVHLLFVFMCCDSNCSGVRALAPIANILIEHHY